MTDHRRWVLRILFGEEGLAWNVGMAAVPTWQPVVGCIIGSDVTCGACIIDEQRVEDQQFRPVQDMWIVECGRLTLVHCMRGRRRGRGSRLLLGGRGFYLVERGVRQGSAGL